MKELIKALGLVLITPFIIVMCMLAVIFFAWPIFCIGFVICCIIAMFSKTIAILLFILMILFVFIILLIKSL